MWRREGLILLGGIALSVMIVRSAGRPTLPFSMGALNYADRVEIATPTRHVKTLMYTRQIHGAAACLGRYSSGWKKHVVKTAVPDLVVSFYQGPQTLGSFGCARGSLTADQRWSHALSDQDWQDMMNVLSTDDAETSSSV